MTEKQIRELVVNTARTLLGYNEADGSHKKIIDLYNSYKPLARGYAVKYNDAWCATFVSAVSIMAGITDIMPTECGCEPMIALYKKHALSKWQEDESIAPEPGDVIFYDWQDSRAGDDTGASDHVGIVAEVNGNSLVIIEGNYSNSVKERKIKNNAINIRGYGKPAYETKSDYEEDFDMDINEAKKKMTSCAETGDNPSEWARKATEYCKEKKIFNGDGAGNYGWQQPITREAVAQIIYNAFEAAGIV